MGRVHETEGTTVTMTHQLCPSHQNNRLALVLDAEREAWDRWPTMTGSEIAELLRTDDTKWRALVEHVRPKRTGKTLPSAETRDQVVTLIASMGNARPAEGAEAGDPFQGAF